MSQYQTATFEQAKIHDALDEANYLRDRDFTRRLTLEAYEVTARRKSARAALRRHNESVHGIVILN